MIRYERIGDLEVQEVDLKGVAMVIKLAELAKDCPDDLRRELIKTIACINSPTIIKGSEE